MYFVQTIQGGRVSSRAIAAAVLALGLLAAVPIASSAQQRGVVTGTITNKQTNQPIIGAQVFLQGTRLGALSDQQGRYSIQNVPPGTYVALVTYLGFSELRFPNVVVRAGAPTTVNAVLDQTVLPMQELVVTGVTAPTEGVKLPFTVATVGKEQLQVSTSGSALELIGGKVAGAYVIRNSGRPGSDAEIQLRSPTA